MTYELAKELKEAGWPVLAERKKTRFLWVLSKKGWNIHFGRTKKQVINMELLGNEVLPCPDLSELIEACGEDFESLGREANMWFCIGPLFLYEGTTPEEAVARLWLALNQKAT